MTSPDGFPDCIKLVGGEWRVRFNGEIQAPAWTLQGPAEMYLQQLQAGKRKPEPAPLEEVLGGLRG